MYPCLSVTVNLPALMLSEGEGHGQCCIEGELIAPAQTTSGTTPSPGPHEADPTVHTVEQGVYIGA